MITMYPRAVHHCIICCPGEYGKRDDETCPGHKKLCLHFGQSWLDIEWTTEKPEEKKDDGKP